jgi:glycosyltransferase involved in cell wall biosynthesis
MISRLHPGKQQHMLIQAFELLAKDYPEWKVEIYGPLSEQEYPRKLQEMIPSLGLTGRVELMGTTNYPLEVLRKADIFAFPSDFPEGFSLALTEAMAVGLPCVGLKITPSVNELIVDGVNGFLTDNTPEDFAAKLKILMDDQNLRAKMGSAGHEMMRQYAPEKVWDQWEELITMVVAQHRE